MGWLSVSSSSSSLEKTFILQEPDVSVLCVCLSSARSFLSSLHRRDPFSRSTSNNLLHVLFEPTLFSPASSSLALPGSPARICSDAGADRRWLRRKTPSFFLSSLYFLRERRRVVLLQTFSPFCYAPSQDSSSCAFLMS